MVTARARVKPIGVGILGLGLAGRGATRSLGASRLTSVEAVCDLNADVTAAVAAAAGARGYTEYSEMLNDPGVEAVFVATPTHFRLPHIEQALRAGKHLMVEKPLASSIKEAQEIVTLAGASDRVLMSVNTRGRDAIVQAMARLVAEGSLGRVLSLTNVMYKPWVLSPRYDYEMDPELGGGVNFRQAPHQVEIARTVIDAPARSVMATVGHVDRPVESFGNFNALVEFDGGAAASLTFNGYGYFDSAELTGGIGEGGGRHEPGAGIVMREHEVWRRPKYSGADPTAALGRSTPRLSIYGLTILSCEYGDIRPSTRGLVVYDEDSIREVKVSPKEGGMTLDLSEFFGAVREGEPCIHDANWGAATVEICEAIWTSALEHRLVQIE